MARYGGYLAWPVVGTHLGACERFAEVSKTWQCDASSAEKSANTAPFAGEKSGGLLAAISRWPTGLLDDNIIDTRCAHLEYSANVWCRVYQNLETYLAAHTLFHTILLIVQPQIRENRDDFTPVFLLVYSDGRSRVAEHIIHMHFKSWVVALVVVNLCRLEACAGHGNAVPLDLNGTRCRFPAEYAFRLGQGRDPVHRIAAIEDLDYLGVLWVND